MPRLSTNPYIFQGITSCWRTKKKPVRGQLASYRRSQYGGKGALHISQDQVDDRAAKGVFSIYGHDKVANPFSKRNHINVLNRNVGALAPMEF